MRYRYIAIEGNIGAGKSTLAKLLSARLHAEFLPEHFDDNPFLPLFYENMDRYAFQVELSFLEERFRHVRDSINRHELIVSDYLWEKSLVFARINLKGEELVLFERIYHLFAGQLKHPDLVIYIHRPPSKLLRHINARGRAFEREIPEDYLSKLGAGYSTFFAAEKRMPVLWLDNELGPEALAQFVLKLMSEKHSNGLHVIR